MAVQAQQYPANVMHLTENHSNRARLPQYEVDQRGILSTGINQNNNNMNFLGKNAFQIPSSVNVAGSNQHQLFSQLTGRRHVYANQQQQQHQLDAAALFNVVGENKDQIHAANVMMGARKRMRDQVEEFCSPWPNPPAAQQQQFVINAIAQLDTHPGSVVDPQSTANVSTGLRLTFEDGHRLRSASPVSTGGRVDAPAPKPTWAENFASHLQAESDEVAQLLKIQSEQLKSFITEKRQRHMRELIAAVEDGYARKLREKDADLDKLRRQNHDLLDRLTQLNAESQHWQTKVRNAEAMINMLQNQTAAAAAAAQHFPLSNPLKEGSGDSDHADDCASSYVDDINDAHLRACNENRELREQRTCRVCRSNDVSMLLLPCRHLCLCQECETQLSACPLCRTPKNASVQVYMS